MVKIDAGVARQSRGVVRWKDSDKVSSTPWEPGLEGSFSHHARARFAYKLPTGRLEALHARAGRACKPTRPNLVSTDFRHCEWTDRTRRCRIHTVHSLAARILDPLAASISINQEQPVGTEVTITSGCRSTSGLQPSYLSCYASCQQLTALFVQDYTTSASGPKLTLPSLHKTSRSPGTGSLCYLSFLTRHCGVL